MTRLAGVCLAFLLAVAPASAQEPVDQEVVDAIRKHGLEDSQVMETLSWLTDVYGPRLTGSPSLRRASEWAAERLTSWGMQNVRLEPWGPFGRGWWFDRFSMHVTEPVSFPVLAYPKAWSAPSGGVVEGEVVLFQPQDDEDLSRYAGQLTGKFVMLDEPRTVAEPFEPPAKRFDAEELLTRATAPNAESGGRRYSEEQLRRYRLRQERFRFVYDQAPAAILDVGSPRGDYGSVFSGAASVPAPDEASWYGGPASYDLDAGAVVPQITLAAEHYNRLIRLIQKGFPVRARFELDATYTTDDPMEYNVIAEIPGTDPEIGDEVVMLGAHLDSWHTGTGATDNASGSAVMMEAMRILQRVFQETGKQPRRTIRLALWTGEEQGLLGSRAYVSEHFATLGAWGEPPSALKPDHAKLSAYYNLDNGAGKIRGIYLQGNDAVLPIFRAWLAPFHDLGATTLTISNTSSTDHIAFDDAGLPGFQFLQDPLAYSRTHHTNMDVYDHVVPDDLKQAATIVASFVYHTAQRDELLPRKPLPVAQPESAVGSR